MKISTHHLPEGISLTLRTPSDDNASRTIPVVILCHGFCGIQDILLPEFAGAFTQAGFATVTFDYRGFGKSDGERGRLVPSMQIDDILSAFRWVKAQPSLDARRTGLWGTSFGGCHVFGAAVRTPEVRCIVSQLAFADGEQIVTGNMSAEEKATFLATLDRMVEKQRNTGKEMFVGITRVLSDAESKAFFEENKTRYPEMDIKIPFLTVQETLRYKPAQNASQVTCPTLIVIAGEDNVNPPEQGKALFEAVSAQEKKLHEERYARHYDMYTGEYFRNVSKIQADWFRKHLMG